MAHPQITEMARFFDERAAGYDHHMKTNVPGILRLYRRVAAQIPAQKSPASILDLGCGTGLELKPLFRRVPQARITGIDLSPAMLERLKRRYRRRAGQLELIRGSYEDVFLGEGVYDYALSVMSLHHFVFERKVVIYERIRKALKPGGLYVEGDYIVSPAESGTMLERFTRLMADAPPGALYHIDIPFTPAEQLRALTSAGFRDVDLIWREGTQGILVAMA